MQGYLLTGVLLLIVLVGLSPRTQAFSPSLGGFGGVGVRSSHPAGEKTLRGCPVGRRGAVVPRQGLRLRMDAGKEGGQSRDELVEKLERRSQELTPEEEKAGEVGLSQYGQGEGTEYVQAPSKRQLDLGTAYVKMSAEQMSYTSLVLDRFADSLGDTFGGKTADPAAKKCKVVVLGTGWGAHALIKTIDADAFDVTVISPRNYFVFTPMLAGAATGTVELRSITESIREANPKVKYLEATATEIDPKAKSVVCESVVCEGAQCTINEFRTDYDKLVVTVGASVNTFGIKGVREHCYFLKQVNDADLLRKAIGNCFERANYPGMSEEERLRTLSFVVVGAGPTGIEFTGELRDFIEKDAARFYPELMDKISVKILEASDRVLMQFESGMQARAIQDLTKPRPNRPKGLKEDYVQVLLKSSVKEVSEREMLLNDGTVIPYGVAVWAAGIGPMPLTLDLINKVPEQKEDDQARGRLIVDRWLRVAGAEGVLALGDCSFLRDSPLPATAQVASQQGTFLGRMLNKGFDTAEIVPRKESGGKETLAKPFQFLNLGILAYTGSGKALAQVEVGEKKIEQAGTVGWLAWRSVYLAKQVSSRNQFMVLFDWFKTSIFGRDLTRF